MRSKHLLLSFTLLFSLNVLGQTQVELEERKIEKEEKPIAYVDNNRYWKKMAKRGLATLNPEVKIPQAVYTGSALKTSGLKNYNSTDIALFDESTTQSENSICIDPNNNEILINSNNSTNNPPTASGVFGANYIKSGDSGQNWNGQKEGAGENNSGDPAVAISRSGRHFVGYITAGSGQGVSYSDDKGASWTSVVVANPANSYSALLDKNHLWIDNAEFSPFEGNLYDAWTPIGGGNINQIEMSRSTDGAETWSEPMVISADANAGSHCQGVNINTGPEGQVYAIYAVYDGFPAGEKAIGFNRSLDGGKTWEPAKRIIDNIRGIRTFDGLGKDMRTNGFPSMTVDISDGPYSGNIYVTWANVGVPGVNAGNGTDIYLIVSSDQGESWTNPIKINQDDVADSKQFFPWICSDPKTGVVSAIFYDDRNVGGEQVEVFCANSIDGGETWEDFKVSDVAFTPKPIVGMAQGYMGDYLSIASLGGKVYPCWPDNRTGNTMTYCSPYEIILLNSATDLNISLNQSSGLMNMSWNYESAPNFKHFSISRNGTEIATTAEKVYSETLSEYGHYDYRITTVYTDGSKAIPAKKKVQWGKPMISINPDAIETTMAAEQSANMDLVISNPGQLTMDYQINIQAPAKSKKRVTYCEASGGQEEHIKRIQLADLDNASSSSSYSDFTEQIANLQGGMSYELKVTSGDASSRDYCVAFIDWNGNGDFEDDGERIEFPNLPHAGPYVTTITIPTAVSSFQTRMRIRNSYGTLPESCGNTSYGEVEDYTLNITNWLVLDDYAGSLNAAEDKTHQLMFNTQGLSDGIYNMDLRIRSNAAENNDQLIPIQLTVGNNPFDIQILTEPASICSGESVNLDVELDDAENCSFAWTSNPAGFTSTEKSPSFTLTHATSFTVEVTKAGEVATASKSVRVNDLPQFDLGDELELCDNISEDIGITAIEGASYLWSTGETTPMIAIEYHDQAELNYSLEVISKDGCSASDEVKVIWKNCVGLDEVLLEDAFKLYPNPAKTKVYLALFKEIKQAATLQVFDMSGRCILSRENILPANQNILDISKLPRGVYSFVLKSAGRVSQEKLIVQ